MAFSFPTRPGGVVSGGGAGVVETGGDGVVEGGGEPPPLGGGGGGGGGGGPSASAVAAPMPSRATTAHAAAAARSPPRILDLPTSTATFELEMPISTRLQQPENSSSCASRALDIDWKHTPVGRDTTALPRGVRVMCVTCVRVSRPVSQVCLQIPGNRQKQVPEFGQYSVTLRLSAAQDSGMPFCARYARC
jgi:hypothetical protein